MNPAVLDALRQCPNLPSPPGIAIRILELARDPDVQMGELAQMLSRDPALAGRVLRTSNSALYGQRRRSETLRQALVVIGLNATMTLALSFSLAETLHDGQDSGVFGRLVWRRALITASAARLLGARTGLVDLEELFLAGLLQDIGVLALNVAIPDEYWPILSAARDHDDLLARERATLAGDHGEAGSWLMRQWGLQDRIALAAAAVHEPDRARLPAPLRKFIDCVAVASRIADAFLGDDRDERIRALAADASRLLGIGQEALDKLLGEVAEVLPEVAELYDTQIISRSRAVAVIEQAREILLARSLNLSREISEKESKVLEMSRLADDLRETASRDPLTGLSNRRHFDTVLEREYALANESRRPLSVGFIDLDHFKSVNDCHGHPVGDDVLAGTAGILVSQLRERDLVTRYGGEEFVVLLPGAGIETAGAVFERLRAAIAAAAYQGANGAAFQVTASIGVAAHMDAELRAATPADLLRAADEALLAAKRSGRNRVCIDESLAR